MADQGLTSRTAFMDWHPPATPNLTVTPRETLTIAGFAAAAGQKDALKDAIRSKYGVELPKAGGRVEGNGIAFIWAGPDHWLAIAEREQNRDMERELKSALGPIASVVDHSDGRVVVRISGSDARKVLAKGVPIDLHPRAFQPGSVAITHASHIGVILWQLDDAPTYEIAMFRSYADSFTHWLFDAAGEFAVTKS